MSSKIQTQTKRQKMIALFIVLTLVVSSMRTAVKKFEKEVKAGNKEAASTNYNIAIQRVDKAMASGKIHKNKAARLKSRLTKLKNAM